jgi:hypothetical protein
MLACLLPSYLWSVSPLAARVNDSRALAAASQTHQVNTALGFEPRLGLLGIVRDEGEHSAIASNQVARHEDLVTDEGGGAQLKGEQVV